MYANMSFREKLIIIYRCIFNDVQDAERSLQIADHMQAGFPDWDEPLRLFYAVFAKQKGFMKCLYDIKTPDEVVTEDKLMFIAAERQNACAYAVETDTGRVFYTDNTNRVAEPLNMKLDEFLLYLIAVQSTQFCACAGKISDCRDQLRSRYEDQRITQHSGEGAVYCFDEGVLAVVNGKDAFVSSRDDSILEAFEESTAFEVDWF